MYSFHHSRESISEDISAAFATYIGNFAFNSLTTVCVIHGNTTKESTVALYGFNEYTFIGENILPALKAYSETKARLKLTIKTDYILLKPYFKDIYNVIYLISGRYWVITTC